MRRIWFLSIIFVIVFTAIIGRLFQLEVLLNEKWRIIADKQHFTEFSLPADRGHIEDSLSNPLVLNQPVYLVYAQPNIIQNVQVFAKSVGSILAIDEKEMIADISDTNRVWVPIARKVVADTVEKLKSLQVSGIGFEPDTKRFYPEASMAAHVLGFVGSDKNGEDKGYFGVEGFYDRELRGKDGMLLQEKDVHGVPIVLGDQRRVNAKNGRTLVLWLDRIVQQIVEKKLAESILKYGAKSGSVTIIDPSTGGIIAMAGIPTYAPDSYLDYPIETYTNPTVAATYEPGSTFKVLVMAAGIEEKLVRPDTKIQETGPVQIGEYSIKTWDSTYRGTVSMTDVLIHSSNVGMVFVGRKLGLQKMLSYIHAYGFGMPSGIDLEEESSPSLRPDREWREIDLATASFGQGIAVTPIQMVRAVAAIANGGWIMEPHVVKDIRDENGRIIHIKPKKIRQVLSPQTAREVTEMMVASVDKGEAQWTKVKGYRIAGKTGTAQIPVSGHYDDKKTIASFVGFAPADNPKFVMLVTLQEPTTSQWGSETAAPLFFSIAKELLPYYGISPL